VCVCVRDAGVHVLGSGLVPPVSELVVVPATNSRDGGFWTPTAAQGRTAGEVQLDSAHHTTGVACRQ